MCSSRTGRGTGTWTSIYFIVFIVLTAVGVASSRDVSSSDWICHPQEFARSIVSLWRRKRETDGRANKHCCGFIVTSVEIKENCICEVIVQPFYLLSLMAGMGTVTKLYAICKGEGTVPHCNRNGSTTRFYSPPAEPDSPPSAARGDSPPAAVRADIPPAAVDQAIHRKHDKALKISNALGWSAVVMLAAFVVWIKRAELQSTFAGLKRGVSVPGDVEFGTIYATAIEDQTKCNSVEDCGSTNRPLSSCSSVNSPEIVMSEPEAPLVALIPVAVKKDQHGTLYFLSKIKQVWKR